MAEGARLESVYTATYRGFESPPHRHIRDESLYESTGSFLLYSPQGGMRTPDRGSTTGAASWTDRARSKRAAPTKTPGAFLNNACVGPAGARPRDGPSNGERSESIPPSPPYFKKSSYASTGFFFRMWPRRHPRGRQQCLSRATRPYPPGSPATRSTAGKRVNPPSPPYFKKSSYACTGFFFACGTADIPGIGSNASPGLPDRTRQVARLSAAPPGGCPKTTKPGLARALLTV